MQNLTVSADGFGGGEQQSMERPFDHADPSDFAWPGGAESVRQFLDADLVDTLHIAVCPMTLGSGSRLRRSPSELDDRFRRDEVLSPSGVVHHLLWHR